MRRYFLNIAYNGTGYHGWQVQNNAPTIQEEINKALQLLLKDPSINVVGCGRTDTGVHAKRFYLHFDTSNMPGEFDDLIYKLNKFLPEGIVVYEILPVDDDAHARFDATHRTYQYYIHLQKNPFKTNQSYYWYGHLNVEAMNEAALALKDYEDFTSFSRLHTQVKTNNCTVEDAAWQGGAATLTFTITANRFLRNMVRAIVGTMLEVGKGKMTIDEFRSVIESKDRSKAGQSAPACGLYLVNVKYPYIHYR